MTELGVYVYGLVAADALEAAPEIPGIDGSHAVECVREGQVCALVSKVPLDQFDEEPLREHLADMQWVEQIARRHQQVLDAVLDVCTPLPMRLCTLYADERGLRQMLERQHDDLSAGLGELHGKLEWGVQAFKGAPGVTAGPPQPGSAEAVSGTTYLQQKLQARRDGEQADADLNQICDRLHAELCLVALAGRLGVPQRPEVSRRTTPMVLNAFYLVANEQSDTFAARVAELADEHGGGLDLELTGPWPPYNFVAAAVGGSQ